MNQCLLTGYPIRCDQRFKQTRVFQSCIHDNGVPSSIRSCRQDIRSQRWAAKDRWGVFSEFFQFGTVRPAIARDIGKRALGHVQYRHEAKNFPISASLTSGPSDKHPSCHHEHGNRLRNWLRAIHVFAMTRICAKVTL